MGVVSKDHRPVGLFFIELTDIHKRGTTNYKKILVILETIKLFLEVLTSK